MTYIYLKYLDLSALKLITELLLQKSAHVSVTGKKLQNIIIPSSTLKICKRAQNDTKLGRLNA